MSRKVFLVLLGFFVAGLTAMPTSTFAASPAPANSTTVAGYQLTAMAGDNITSIKASWYLPEVTCSAMETSYSNVSIMIDGFASPNSDQLRIGTTSNCISGKATYGVFYVLNLANGVKKVAKPLPTVSPTDLIKVTGKWNPGGAPKHGGSTNQGWEATITDTASGITGKVSDKSSTKAALNSAAFVVGKPNAAALADFGTVGFGNYNTGVRSTCELTAGISSNNTVYKAISIGSLADHQGFTLTQYTMVNGLDVLATTSSLQDTKGKSFAVTFNLSS